MISLFEGKEREDIKRVGASMGWGIQKDSSHRQTATASDLPTFDKVLRLHKLARPAALQKGRLTHHSTTMSPTIPKTCKAVVLESVGAPWTIKEVPVPTPAENEVLIKVAACGVCHSDLFLQSGAFGDCKTVQPPDSNFTCYQYMC